MGKAFSSMLQKPVELWSSHCIKATCPLEHKLCKLGGFVSIMSIACHTFNKHWFNGKNKTRGLSLSRGLSQGHTWEMKPWLRSWVMKKFIWNGIRSGTNGEGSLKIITYGEVPPYQLLVQGHIWHTSRYRVELTTASRRGNELWQHFVNWKALHIYCMIF